MAQNSEIDQLIQSIQEQYASDRRVEVFTITVSQLDETTVLEGETTSKPAYDELLQQIQQKGIQIEDKIRLLPNAELGDKTFGIIYNSVGTLRFEPRYSAEIVSQGLMGMPVRILEKKGGWQRIQTPDKYIGWMNGSVQEMTKSEQRDYLAKPKVVVTALSVQSFEAMSDKSGIISDLVAGDMLALKGEKRKFYLVEYADGREAYVRKQDAEKASDWLKNIDLSGESIVRKAFHFSGIPYLWGGTSSKGLDCSGFSKSVYFMHGIIIPRDASQQVHTGKLIDETGNFDKLQPGDLVFFGTKATDENPKERVVHVGIYIGNKRFIHASDFIRVGSFNPSDELYDKYNTNRYLRAKRIIGEVGTKGIDAVFENEFYK